MRVLRTVAAFVVALSSMALFALEASDASASTVSGGCIVSLLSTVDTAGGSSATAGFTHSPSDIQLKCDGMPSNTTWLFVVIYSGTEEISTYWYNGSGTGTAWSSGDTGLLEYGPVCPFVGGGQYCDLPGGHYVGNESWIPDTSDPPGATVEAGAIYSADIGAIAAGFQNTSILPVYGAAGQCTPTSESGFYSGSATGTSTYTWTLSFTGESQIIAADTEDGSTPAVSNNGQNFSNDSVFQATGADPGFSPVVSNTIFITTKPVAGADPDAVHFYCYDAGQWYDWGTPASGGSGALPSPPGCSGMTWTGSTTNSRVTIYVQMEVSSDSAALVLDPVTAGTPSITVPGTDSKMWDSDIDYHENPGSDTELSVLQAAASTGGAELWCYDTTTSTWIDKGSVSGDSQYGVTSGGLGSVPTTGTGDSGCFDLSTHLATSGMSLDDPVSWVTGLAKDTGYIVEWAFVPCTSIWDETVNQFGFTSSGKASGTCGATAPGGVTGTVSQWLGAGFTMIADGPSCSFGAMQSEEAAGITSSYLSTGDTFTSDGHSYSASIPAAIDTVTSSSRLTGLIALLLLIDTAILGVGFFFAIKSLIQSLVGGS